jgi:hypothetical protein
MRRSVVFGIITFLMVIGVIELMSWGFAAFATRIGALHFFRPKDLFSRLPDVDLTKGTRSNGLGWPSNDNPRAVPVDAGPACGSAFGDSFTFGLEVEDSETWVHLLSRRSGCTIRNYGVNAYGFDQAVLRYERIAPKDNVVIFGLITEMPRRSVAASWTFYSGNQPPVYTNIKPYFTLSDADLRLHPIPVPLTREAIAAHHANDYYLRHGWTTPGFPNAIQVARAAYATTMRWLEYRLRTEAFWDAAHPSGAGVLTRRLIDRLVQAARGRNEHLVIVLMPILNRLLSDTPEYDRFADELRRRGDICVIDAAPSMRAHARLVGINALSAPGQHPNALGSRLIAEAVAAGLDRCGIKLD